MKFLKDLVRKAYHAVYNVIWFRVETYSGPAGKIKAWRRRTSGEIANIEVTVEGEVEVVELLDVPDHTLKWLTECDTPDNLRIKAKMALNWYGEDE